MKRFASTRSEKRAVHSDPGLAQCSVGSIEDDGIRYGLTTHALIASTIAIAPAIVTIQSMIVRQGCGNAQPHERVQPAPRRLGRRAGLLRRLRRQPRRRLAAPRRRPPAPPGPAAASASAARSSAWAATVAATATAARRPTAARDRSEARRRSRARPRSARDRRAAAGATASGSRGGGASSRVFPSNGSLNANRPCARGSAPGASPRRGRDGRRGGRREPSSRETRAAACSAGTRARPRARRRRTRARPSPRRARPGSLRAIASTSTIAGSSPPERTYGPIEIASEARFRTIRSSKPSKRAESSVRCSSAASSSTTACVSCRPCGESAMTR